MAESTLLKKMGEIGAAGGWPEIVLCHSKKVNGREIAAHFCFQKGHWSRWKTRYMQSFPTINSKCEKLCTFKLLLIDETFPLNVLCYFAVKRNLLISKPFTPFLFHNVLSTKRPHTIILGGGFRQPKLGL